MTSGCVRPLILVKIYREAEFEQEIDRLKAKVDRYKKSSKSSTGSSVVAEHSRLSIASNASTSAGATSVAEDAEICELCEQPGHDIINCSAFAGTPSSETPNDMGILDMICEDCEQRGHVASDCPHKEDVF